MMAAGWLAAYPGPAAMLGCDWRPSAGLTLRTTYMRFAPPRTNEPELTERTDAGQALFFICGSAGLPVSFATDRSAQEDPARQKLDPSCVPYLAVMIE